MEQACYQNMEQAGRNLELLSLVLLVHIGSIKQA